MPAAKKEGRTLAQIDREMDGLRKQKETIQEKLRVLARERDVAFERETPPPGKNAQSIGNKG